jgi:hypothetical protein
VAAKPSESQPKLLPKCTHLYSVSSVGTHGISEHKSWRARTPTNRTCLEIDENIGVSNASIIISHDSLHSVASLPHPSVQYYPLKYRRFLVGPFVQSQQPSSRLNSSLFPTISFHLARCSVALSSKRGSFLNGVSSMSPGSRLTIAVVVVVWMNDDDA